MGKYRNRTHSSNSCLTQQTKKVTKPLCLCSWRAAARSGKCDLSGMSILVYKWIVGQ